MSDKREDGGPAFPYTVQGWNGNFSAEGGMSLRDWFAGQALMGQMAFSPHDSFEKVHLPNEVAELAYRFADAMLRARQGTSDHE